MSPDSLVVAGRVGVAVFAVVMLAGWVAVAIRSEVTSSRAVLARLGAGSATRTAPIGSAGGVVAVAAVAARAAARAIGRRRMRRELVAARRLDDALPELVDLLVVAAMGGTSVRGAFDAAIGHHRQLDLTTNLLQPVARRLSGGARFADALDDTMATLPSASRRVLQPLVTVLLDADRYGGSLADGLTRLGDDLRRHRRHRAEAAARRVPVRLLLPLVCCVLPSFALLTVAPLLAGAARGALADRPSIPLDLPEVRP